MNVGELIAKLSRLDPNLPVLMQQSDDPLGDYEVLDVSVVPGKPDDLYHRTAVPRHGGRPWDYQQVWHTYERGDIEVVLLGSEKPWQPVVDAEVVQREIGPS
jgi:hypothetical protein